MKKIAVVLASLNAGGAETRMLDILRNINRNEYKMDFIVFSLDSCQFYEEEILNYDAKIYKLNNPNDVGIIKHLFQLYKIFKENKYDAVHANTSFHCGLIMLMAAFCKVPVRISHARTNKLRHRNIITYTMYYIGKILIHCFATVKMAISEESANFLFFSKKNYVILPNAIDVEKFCFLSRQEVYRLKKEYNLATNKIIGHIGRFDKAKNQSFLIRVFSHIKKEIYNSKLILIGEGEYKQQCEKLVNKYGLKDDVLFLGNRRDIHIWMNVFDIFVFPSEYEGLGNVAIEAQASGKKSICSSNVPKSVDLGLDLVKFFPLELGEKWWAEAIIKEKIHTPVHEKEDIVRSFDERGFTIRRAVEILSNIYKG